MTLKEKFNSIDQSRITADQKAFLDKMKNVTKDFTLENKEVNDKVEGALDKMIASFKEKMPDAIKTSTKVVVPKTAKSKKTTKVVSKTTTPKRTVMSVAKEIRKEGESWADAQKRAKAMIKEDKADVSEVVKTELDRINKFINSRKELKGISGTNIKRDAVRTAKPRGARTVTRSGETSNQYGTFNNKLGRKYWESRDRHADRLAPNYPKDAPLLEDGGMVSEDLFENYAKQPKELSEIVNSYMEKFEEGDYDYQDSQNFLKEVESIGYTFDYGLDNEPYGLRPIGTKLKEYKLGGRVEEVYFFQADNKEIRDDFFEDLQNYMPDHSKTKLGDLSIQIFADKNDASNLMQMANSTNGVVFVEEKFAEGGYLTDPTFGTFQNQVFENGGGVNKKLKAGVYRVGKPTKVSNNFYEQKIVEIFENGDIATASDYGRKLGDFKSQEYPIISKEQLDAQYKYEFGGDFQAGVYAKGGGFRFKNNRKYDVGSNWTNDHNQFDKGAEHEVQYRKRNKFELGGVMATDLAGHTGGSLGTGDPSLLSGTSGTGYTGLVGETGAMSSGEMFEYGGGLPNGVSQSYMVTEAFGNPAQHFANGGGLPAGAEQSYINYYLGEGSAQGIYKKGGSVENQYEGRTPKDIWDNLSQSQRNHFLHDHNKSEIQSTPSSLDEFSKKSYNFLPTKVKRSFEMHVATGQYKAGGMLNANERYVLEIKGLTGLRKEAIENYIAENNLSDNDVLNIVIGLGRKQLKGSDVASAVVGKKGNALSKEVIQFAKDNKGMKLEEGGNIDAFTLRMVKGTAGKPDEAMTEPRSVQFKEGGAVSFRERRNKYLETLGVGESKVWDKIGAESGSEIRNNSKMLKSYAEGVEEMLQKKGVGKGSFDQEDYDFYTDENWHLFNEFLVWNNYYEPDMTKVEKAWRLKYSKDGEKSQYVSDPEVITLNSTKRKSETESKSETDKKYIVNADIESVTVKKAGKEVTYSGKDVLNGANILKDGGGIEDKASYFSKNNVVSVKLKNGQTIKPANGYWVEKDATPIKKMETGGGVQSKDTWQNLLEDYGFKKSRSKYGIDIYKKRGYVATVDSKERNVELMFDDELIYEGYSVQGLLASLKDEFSSRYGANSKKMETGGDLSEHELFLKLKNSLKPNKRGANESKLLGYTMYEKNGEYEITRRIDGNEVDVTHLFKNFFPYKSKSKMETGGKFEKLSKSVAKNYEGKRVKPEYQNEYGKIYSKEEAKEVGDKVAGKVKASQKMMAGGEAKKRSRGSLMLLAKEIRKDGESWKDAMKRAGQQLK